MQRKNEIIIVIKRLGALITSFKAINTAGLTLVLLILRMLFLPKRSPVCPERIASIGVSFFTLPVHPYANARITIIVPIVLITFIITPALLPSTIFSVTDAISRLPKGMLAKKPITPPTKAISRYFTM